MPFLCLVSHRKRIIMWNLFCLSLRASFDKIKAWRNYKNNEFCRAVRHCEQVLQAWQSISKFAFISAKFNFATKITPFQSQKSIAISRVLSWMLIYLALFSQTKSSEGFKQRHQPPLLAADWVCRAEFVAKIAGGLLPRRFTFAVSSHSRQFAFCCTFP